MAAVGFYEQKQVSPLSFGIVLALHGAAIVAVWMVKTQSWADEPVTTTKIYEVRDLPPPPVEPPPPDRPIPEARPLSRIEVQRPVVQPREIVNSAPLAGPTSLPPGPIVGNDPAPAPSSGTGEQVQQVVTTPPREPVRLAVRVDAQFDPRYAGAQQPPYPPSEVRREREGAVRIRVTIGPDGRVTAAERLSATSDAFWDATQRQALNQWRFRPATLDGRPVQSVKVLNIRFRLDG